MLKKWRNAGVRWLLHSLSLEMDSCLIQLTSTTDANIVKYLNCCLCEKASGNLKFSKQMRCEAFYFVKFKRLHDEGRPLNKLSHAKNKNKNEEKDVSVPTDLC